MICPKCGKDEMSGWLFDPYDAMEHNMLSRIGWIGIELLRCPCGYRKLENILISNELTDFLNWYIYIDNQFPFIHIIKLKPIFQSGIAIKYRKLGDKCEMS